MTEQSLHATIEAEWKTAMKARSPSKDALNQIKAELKNKLISMRHVESERQLGVLPDQDRTEMDANEAKSFSTELNNETTLSVLNRMAKQRRESIEAYTTAQRDDLVNKEAAELAVIEHFLPKQMTEAELEELIRLTITEVSANGPKDLGKLMKVLSPKTKSKVDGRLLQAKVKELLV